MRDLLNHELRLRIDLKTHAYNLVAIKEAKWKQRSSANWPKNRDSNVKYFHAVASARRAINFIPQITVNQTENNQPPETITGTPTILMEFTKHYKNLLDTKHTTTHQPNLTGLYAT
jgi:Reverse transcriptase (RNA-dependent DNA polymerase)